MRFRQLLHRLLALGRRRQLERELDDEILAHLELAERDASAAGLSPAEARRAARLAFGGVDQMKEDHRDSRGVRWLETLTRDVRYGLASLTRDPGFTVVVVGVLALGIGANAAMFSLVDAVLLKPIPFPDPDRIVRVWEAPRPGVTNSTSTLDFLDWQRLATSFSALAAERPVAAALTGQGEPLRLPGRAVTPDYFAVFAAHPQMGRTFRSEDADSGAPPVIVLSHAAWQTYFGGARDILEQRPVFDGRPHQIVGVLPAGAFDRDDAEFWTPLVFTPDVRRRDWHWLVVHGRLRDGVTLEQAREQMTAIDAALTDVVPIYKRDWTIVVQPLERLLVGDDLRESIRLVFGAVAVVLLIACANVTNLLLARGAARGRELAVRMALGASRGRLVAQLLTETLVLCVAGAGAGIGLAVLLLAAAKPVLAEAVPYTADVRLDGRVLSFVALVALAVAIVVGILPSLRASWVNLSSALHQFGRGASRGPNRIRRSIVVAEVAMSLILVCAALLLFRSLQNQYRLDTGVRVDGVITMSVDLGKHAYPTPESAALLFESLVQRVEGAPGIEGAGLTTHLPLRWIGNGEAVRLPGIDEAIAVRFKRVDSGYFDTFDIPTIAGRSLARTDRYGSPRVVVINQALAARLAEVGRIKDPIGQVVQVRYADYSNNDWKGEAEIVGVIRSERVAAPWRPDPPVLYVPLTQFASDSVKMVVRAHTDPAAAMPAIREAVREVAPNLPLGDVTTMEQVRDRTFTATSRPAWLIGAFAVVAALLAALGLYGVLAHMVTERRREVGIRMALGARSRDVLLQILKGAVVLVAIGLALGLAGAFAVTRVMDNLLFQVSPVDPLAFTLACACLTVIAVVAALIPAQRAAAVHPVAVLRDEG
jgi:predicted permease